MLDFISCLHQTFMNIITRRWEDTRLLKLEEALDLKAHYAFLLTLSPAPIRGLIRSKDEWATRSLSAPHSSFLLRHTQVLIVLSLLGATRETGQRLSLTSPPLLVRRKVLQANSESRLPVAEEETVEFKGSQAVVHHRSLNDDNMHGSESNTI